MSSGVEYRCRCKNYLQTYMSQNGTVWAERILQPCDWAESTLIVEINYTFGLIGGFNGQFLCVRDSIVGEKSWALKTMYIWRTVVKDCWTYVQNLLPQERIIKGAPRQTASARYALAAAVGARSLQMEHWSREDQGQRNVDRKDWPRVSHG